MSASCALSIGPVQITNHSSPEVDEHGKPRILTNDIKWTIPVAVAMNVRGPQGDLLNLWPQGWDGATLPLACEGTTGYYGRHAGNVQAHVQRLALKQLL